MNSRDNYKPAQPMVLKTRFKNLQKKGLYASLGLLLIAIAGCSSTERSRNLGNSNISANTLATQVCSNCHGPNGNSISPNFPNLAGQQKEYLVNQLKGFRSHGRSDPEGFEYMWGIVRHLTDDQVTGLAEYYSKQSPHQSDLRAADPKLLAAGKEIFEKGVPAQNVIACTSCHGPKAQGMAAFPKLAHQHADYLVKQLNVFQNTHQRPGTPMEAIAHPLSGENKEAVAAYLQAFPD